jgi:hypothetical protein
MAMIASHLKKFIILFIILTIVIYTCGFALFNTILKDYYFGGFLFMPILFFGITLGVHIHLVRISQEDIKKFTPRFIGTTGIKMGLYFALIIVYLLIDRNHAVPFLISFLIMYLIYTIFEIVFVLSYLKRK